MSSTITAALSSMVGMARVFYRANRSAWYMDFKDHDGVRRLWRGGKTRSEAEIRLASIVSQQALVRAGLVTKQQYELAQWSKCAIEELRDEYLTSLRARVKSPAYIKETERMINAWIIGAAVEALEDVDAGKTEAWLADNPGWSYRTRNAYLKAAVGFLNWCVKRMRIAANPLRQVELLNEREDPKQPSRALTREELAALLAETPLPRRGYYALAARAGLRWGEIAKLTWGQLNIGEGWIRLKAKGTKNRRDEDLPLADDVLEILRMIPSAGSTVPVFTGRPTVQTWVRDLIRAGIVRLPEGKKRWSKVEELIGYANEHGQLDRKCLRKTFNTHLAIEGVDAQTRQKLMRHSDIRLTTNVYVSPHLLDLRGAVNRSRVQAVEAPGGAKAKLA